MKACDLKIGDKFTYDGLQLERVELVEFSRARPDTFYARVLVGGVVNEKMNHPGVLWLVDGERDVELLPGDTA